MSAFVLALFASFVGRHHELFYFAAHGENVRAIRSALRLNLQVVQISPATATMRLEWWAMKGSARDHFSWHANLTCSRAAKKKTLKSLIKCLALVRSREKYFRNAAESRARERRKERTMKNNFPIKISSNENLFAQFESRVKLRLLWNVKHDRKVNKGGRNRKTMSICVCLTGISEMFSMKCEVACVYGVTGGQSTIVGKKFSMNRIRSVSCCENMTKKWIWLKI